MSYIKLDRKISEWEWFTDGNMLKVWVYLLTHASYKESSYQGHKLKPGQLIIGRKILAQRLEMSERQIRTCLEKLKKTEEVTIKTTNKFSIITIVKWAEYQCCDDDSDQQQVTPPTNERPTNDQQSTTYKEIKNYKKERNIFIRPTLDDVVAYCRERNRGVDPNKWYNYYSSNGWKVGKNSMKDWKAAVRTWERNTTPEDTIPTYDTSNNSRMSKEEQEELLKLMGRA